MFQRAQISVRRRPRRAVILILSFWIAIILSMMAYTVAREVQLNLRMARDSGDMLRARGLARAGLAKAVADLSNDRLLAVADPIVMLTDSERDVWANPEDKTEMELDGGTYTVRVEDEDGKINLNVLTMQSSPMLGHVISEVTGIEAYPASVLASLIVDYQDEDRLPVTGAGDTEFDVYDAYLRENFGESIKPGWKLRMKNDRIVTLDELLEIPPFTRQMLYGSSEERREWADATLMERREESPFLADYITVQASRFMNLNTMSSRAFAGLMSVVQPGGIGAKELGFKFRQYREALGQTDGETSTIRAIDQLETIGIGKQLQGVITTIYPLNPSSRFFRISSRGEYNGAEKRIEVRVTVDMESFPADPEMRDRDEDREKDRARGQLRNRSDTIIDPVVRVVEIREM